MAKRNRNEKQSFLTIYSTNNKQETTQLKPDTTIQDVLFR
jgi:hypothetical protein